MTTLTETPAAGAFLASEANGTRSRETVTILSGQTLQAGTVLGKVAVGTASAAADAGNTGTGTIGAVSVGAGAMPGAYRAVCIEPGTNAGKFAVENPAGVTVGVATVAVAFSGGGLGFTIADGGTDFASGDSFTITVAAGSGKYTAYDPDNTDGSGTAVAVLFAAVDASDGHKAGVAVVRDAEVVAERLVWFAGATSNEKAAGMAELATVGIIAR